MKLKNVPTTNIICAIVNKTSKQREFEKLTWTYSPVNPAPPVFLLPTNMVPLIDAHPKIIVTIWNFSCSDTNQRGFHPESCSECMPI